MSGDPNTDIKSWLQFEDWQKYIKSELGQESWLTVYRYTKDNCQKIYFDSALIPHSLKEKALSDVYWNYPFSSGMPYHIGYGATQETKYFRFGNDEGIEPLVFYRSFYDIKEPYLEVSEEFRHFFKLYHDNNTGNYTHIDDNGDEEEVIKIENEEIRIKLSYIKKFLAIKEMYLAIQFDIWRFGDKTIEELNLKESSQTNKENNYCFEVGVKVWNNSNIDNRKSFAWLTGKKLIQGLKNYRANSWDKEEKQFCEFIIGVDENGNEIYHTCDLTKPYHLKPVFFKRDVLTKYYANDSKYSIKDGLLRCRGLWVIPIDNNHEKCVTVFLRDLGLLPYKEQLYWKSFNVPPEGKISNVAFRRSFMCEFTDPERSDLLFKDKFNHFREKWFQKYNWDLFKQLNEDDQHVFNSLRIPLNDTQQEFDQQSSYLSKILVETLNERELEKYITKEKDEKGIRKFSRYLDAQSVNKEDKEKVVKFLRNLRSLRSGEGHVKGDDYKKAMKYFNPNNKNLVEVFDNILKQAIDFLDRLENLLI